MTPSSDSTLPLSTWPANLAGGDTGRRSSIAPTTNITAPASNKPSGSVVSVNTSRNCGTCDATPNATRNPRNIAAPPSDGSGSVCTLRGPGIAIAPMRGASHRMGNVNANVTTAAISEMVR